MKKIIIIFMALLLGLFIEVSSAVEVNLLGPNKYKRTTGKPNFFTEAFQGELGTGKLIILNGEANGENRVSSALILLNGTQVIGPKSFNQKVYNIEIPVSLSENNSISVELRSSPGSYLTIQVKEEMTQSTRPVGPGGGILKFHNGVILDVPADAVTEETAITVKDLKCSDVDAIVTSEINVFHPKRCLGGFSAEPTNLVFQLPVTATLPVLLLEPGELPIQLTVDLNNQIYSRGPTDLIYYGDQGVAEIKILHFSHLVVTAEEHVVVPEDPCQKAGLPEEECKTKSVACESCDYNKNNQDLCNKLNPYAAIGENSCCTVPPKARAQCWGQGGCDCCTEKRIHVVASAIDFASTDACQIVSENVTVTFLDCHVNPSDPQSPPPTMTDSASEASEECKDYHFTISIVPSEDTLALCENKQLKASIKGTSPDGKKTMTSDVFKPDWKSEDPGKVKIDHDGWAKRLQEGVVQVKAYVEKKPNEKPIIDPGFATIGTSPPNFCKYTLTWHADISWWAWFSDYSWHSEKGSWNGRIEVASDKSSVISKSMDCTDYAWYPSIAYNASMTRAQADSWVNQWAINLPSRFREAASEDGKLRLLDPFVPIPPLQVKWQDIGCPPTEGYYCGGTQVYPADYYMSPGDLDADDTCGSSFSKTVTYPWAKADGWIDMGSGNLTWDVKVVKEACPPPSP